MPLLTERSTAEARLRPFMLANGTIPARDVDASRSFYENVLGLEVHEHGANELILRLGSDHTYVVEQVPDLQTEMPLLNHNGIWVADDADLDTIHDRLTDAKDELGIKVLQRPRRLHGPYAFWFQDRDGNWWELNHRLLPTDDLTGQGEMTAEQERAWFQKKMLEGRELGQRGWQSGDTEPRGLIEATRLSHGTLESRDLQASRRFYEEVLGLEVKQGSPASLHVHLGNDHNYAVVAGPRAPDMPPYLRNSLLFDAPADIDAAFDEARALGGRYGIGEITEPQEMLDRYCFRLRDLDNNWWELAYQVNGGHHRNFAPESAGVPERT